MRGKPNLYVRPGTTPIISFYLPFEVDLVAELWFTMVQRGVEVFTKELDDMEIEGSKIIVKMTQEETLKLASGQKVEIQVRIRTTGDDAIASQVETVDVDRILKNGVI